MKTGKPIEKMKTQLAELQGRLGKSRESYQMAKHIISDIKPHEKELQADIEKLQDNYKKLLNVIGK